ncbi:bifunctional hydroxymethylpyrimidine kinase/phosphomethylpyrimidine kinase [Oceanobacillus halotolerans]|uniref:bifunctional hydroxymethylpyrimidine kinase/phosphomethylpyrimidine kinase n=1 Tax=Oceanobacillus halotolerans TaxID=2663380 RepID=UPI0013DC7219|nr:bifunctional hydroxymethylpyrimidine kinase/phosphomethylpyrimidine kinase [Oceanobacillus halotolerans]
MKKPARVLTIAGSAAGGSAGIQADLKTFQELDVYGMSVITAIVAKHPVTRKNIHLQTVEAIEAQFATARKQVGVDAVKTGMLFSKDIIQRTAHLIRETSLQHVIVDPVMVGKMGSILLDDDAIEVLKQELIPQATIITPNLHEASILLDNRPLTTIEDLKQATIDLYSLGSQYVLIKGGRNLNGPAVDVLFNGKTVTLLEAPKIDTRNTSGAGCTYSAAIAAYVAKGKTLIQAVELAKDFVTTAISYGFSYTDIVGPTYHAARRKFGSEHAIKIDNEE